MLSDLLADIVETYPERPALWVDGHYYSYGRLADLAERLLARTSSLSSPLAIHASRTVTAYAAIFAAALSSRPYVFLNPRHPLARNLEILRSVEAGDLVGDGPDAEALLDGLSDGTSADGAEGLAYILFTSGTTGKPKGVPITQENLLSYIKNIRKVLAPTEEDRFLQIADLGFDMSVHDVFVAWLTGACVYSVPEGKAAASDRIIQDFSITTLMLVPSTAALIKSQGRLVAKSLPSLRQTFFCGEALPSSLAGAWQAAAPNSIVWNMYGPTEATVAIGGFKWSKKAAADPVPIGRSFADQKILLVDEMLLPTAKGKIGEILLSGSQVASGYWKDDAASEKFVQLQNENWYRTGDLAVDTIEYGLCYRGRLDQQVKVRGFRVEILEIEVRLREVAESELVAVVGWPFNSDGMAMGTVAFVVDPRVTEAEMLEHCKNHLPDYMVPTRVISIQEIPTNAHGKIDYGKLTDLLRDHKV